MQPIDGFEAWYRGFFATVTRHGGYAGIELDPALVKATLKDYYDVQRHVATALAELTGGKLTKCNYTAQDIVTAVRHSFGEAVVAAMNGAFAGDDIPFPSEYGTEELEASERPTLPSEAITEVVSNKVVSFPADAKAAPRHPWADYGPAKSDRFPKEGDIYEHYKGGRYCVVSVAMFSEATWLHVVVYRSLKDGYTWARPLAMWNQTVEVNGERVPRFRKLEE